MARPGLRTEGHFTGLAEEDLVSGLPGEIELTTVDRILSVGADLGFKERTMPVEARRETFRDPGSTPGASTIFNHRVL